MALSLSPRVRQSLSALAVLAAVLLVGRVINPAFRRDVTVRVNLHAWHVRALPLRSVGVCVYAAGESICALERRFEGIAPEAFSETLRLPRGPLRVEIRVVGGLRVETLSYAVDPGEAERVEFRAPEPP